MDFVAQASFSQLDYIPESQPLFENEASIVSEPGAPVESPVVAVVGEGLAAVRALYATSAPATSTSVPFHQTTSDVKAAPSTPQAGLSGSLKAEAGASPGASVVADPAVDVWVQCYDEESGWPYVYNEATGEVKWVEPESTEQLLAVLWEVCYDEDGNEFYYNQVLVVTHCTVIVKNCNQFLHFYNFFRKPASRGGNCRRTPRWLSDSWEPTLPVCSRTHPVVSPSGRPSQRALPIPARPPPHLLQPPPLQLQLQLPRPVLPALLRTWR